MSVIVVVGWSVGRGTGCGGRGVLVVAVYTACMQPPMAMTVVNGNGGIGDGGGDGRDNGGGDGGGVGWCWPW